MKKKSLFILMLCVSLTGFKGKVVTPDSLNATWEVFSSEQGPPKIMTVEPDKGKVFGFEGQVITFYVKITANPGATYQIKKGEKVLKKSTTSITSGNVEYEIRNAQASDSGDYTIVVTNELGSVQQEFRVTINRKP